MKSSTTYDNQNITYDSGNTNEKRDTIENIMKYNKPGITWDTNTFEDCFRDGDELLKKLPLNAINADLKGEKPITIETKQNSVVLLGNNNLYTGIMTLPEHITDMYLQNNSKVKNIKHINDNKLNKLHFHYEYQKKPEKQDKNFCVPFSDLEKTIETKNNKQSKFRIDNKSFSIYNRFNYHDDKNKYTQDNDEFEMNGKEHNHSESFNKDKEIFDKYREKAHKKYLEE